MARPTGLREAGGRDGRQADEAGGGRDAVSHPAKLAVLPHSISRMVDGSRTEVFDRMKPLPVAAWHPLARSSIGRLSCHLVSSLAWS